ncbi:chord-domain-containing protein [Exidia glandulosa HHB12029]|uniref:Chord-domain-containing protein n=1 Tax=Exidia glandulosa HHB12029 TaxID=1314781 RepID=A0A165IFK5_EXIGL|nr:chord-domain-containing protein [Exidia glandulosa HHB12029]
MKCSRNGCGQEFDPASNPEGSCTFHSGGPVFHEGLKSWSCCAETNKPVLDFESFLALPGCTTGAHTAEAPKAEPARSTGISNYKDPAPAPTNADSAPAPPPPPPTIPPPQPKPVVYVEEPDDLTVPVAPGTQCLRTGCKKTFISDEASRLGDGPEAECQYHPAPPLFREGSKGYMCCKRKVLEFEEFLKIEGCKKGRHMFVKKKAPAANGEAVEELVTCRVDYYQTPGQVHASVFAKKADKEKTKIQLLEDKVELDISLPDSKRFVRTLNLYGPIKPESSSITFYGTKIELLLTKQDNRSWNSLEKTEQDVGHITFGVSGRTGTIGGKALVLDENNKLRSAA